MRYNVTYSCGHHGVVDLYGPTKEREHKLAWYQSECLCDDCAARIRAEENSALGFPELEGSEKQVKWADDLRHKFHDAAIDRLKEMDVLIERMEREKYPRHDEAVQIRNQYAEDVRVVMQGAVDARFWIDNRDHLYTPVKVIELYKTQEENEA